MKHTWLVGALASIMLAGVAAAQTPYSTPSQKPTTTQSKPATQKPAPTAEKPAPPAKPATTTQKPATTEMQKPATTTRRTMRAPAEVPTGETVLGTVTIPRAVMADGKTLPGGRYTVRLTAQSAQPTVAGQKPDLNRWVEFMQGNAVKGREVVSIVPADEVDDTQQGPDLEVGRSHVPPGQSRVETLKGGDYVRVWFNRGGNNYLVHLPPSGTATR